MPEHLAVLDQNTATTTSPPPKRAPKTSAGANRLRTLVNSQAASLALVIIVLAVVLQINNPVFLTPDNVITLLRSAVTTFVIGCAATIVFTSGGLDLSVGAVFNFGGMTVGLLLVGGVPWPIALFAGLVVGALLGLVNAALIIVAKVPPIIATLATFYAVGGAAIILTDGAPIAPLPEAFTTIGQSSIGTIPLLLVYALVVGVVFYFVLARTRFGYNVQAVGGNEHAALANGVKVKKIKAQVYAISGMVAALAGILYAARTGTADPQAGGTDLTFAVITAVLIGGTSLFGGIGSIVGTAMGAILFAIIQNGLTVAGVNPLYSNVIIGTILAAAVALDSWRRSRAFASGRR